MHASLYVIMYAYLHMLICICAMPDISVTSLCVHKKNLFARMHKHMKSNGILVEKPLGFVFYFKLRFELKYRTKPNKNEGSGFSLFVEL